MPGDNSSPLLALPVELLDQITEHLNDEVLPTLRLTCKTLDFATFDRFTDVYISKRACYIFNPARLQLISDLLNGSQRLADRLRELTFTCDYLEGKSPREIHTTGNSTERGDHYSKMQEQDMEAYVVVWNELEAEREAKLRGKTIVPHYTLIRRILLDVKTKSPHAHIRCQLRGFCINEMGFCPIFLQAVAFESVPLHSLTLSDQALSYSDHLFRDYIQLKSRLLHSTSSLEGFVYQGHPNTTSLKAESFHIARVDKVESILRSAPNLRELTLDLGENMRRSPSPSSSPLEKNACTTLMPAHDYRKVDTLELSMMHMFTSDLLQVLSRCAANLTHVTLRTVSLDSEWSGVLQAQSDMPKLRSLRLRHLHVRNAWGVQWRPVTPHGAGPQLWEQEERYCLELSGRTEVLEGLQKLLGRPIERQ